MDHQWENRISILSLRNRSNKNNPWEVQEVFLGDQRVNPSSTYSFANVMQGGWRTARKNRAEVRENFLRFEHAMWNLQLIYSIYFVFVGYCRIHPRNLYIYIYFLETYWMFRFHNPFVYFMFAYIRGDSNWFLCPPHSSIAAWVSSAFIS